jgi:hypothetical protein
MSDSAVLDQILTADPITVSDLFDEATIPAEATNAVEAVSQVDDPATLHYIVTENADDPENAVEILSVGLAKHFKKWSLDKKDVRTAYFLALHKAIQLQYGVGVRLATKKDVESRGGEREVAAAVNLHLNWDAENEKKRNANAVVISEAFAEMATSQAGVKVFVEHYALNTNQLKAIAVRASKASPPFILPAEVVHEWAAYAYSRLPGKDSEKKTTVRDLEKTFY